MGTVSVSGSPMGCITAPWPSMGGTHAFPFIWLFEGGGSLQVGMEGAISDFGYHQIKAQKAPGSEDSGRCYIQLSIWFQRAHHELYLNLDV